MHLRLLRTSVKLKFVDTWTMKMDLGYVASWNVSYVYVCILVFAVKYVFFLADFMPWFANSFARHDQCYFLSICQFLRKCENYVDLHVTLEAGGHIKFWTLTDFSRQIALNRLNGTGMPVPGAILCWYWVWFSYALGVPRRQPHRRSGLATLPFVGAVP